MLAKTALKDAVLTDPVDGKDLTKCKMLNGKKICCKKDEVNKFGDKFKETVKSEIETAKKNDKVTMKAQKYIIKEGRKMKNRLGKVARKFNKAISKGDKSDKGAYFAEHFYSFSNKIIGNMKNRIGLLDLEDFTTSKSTFEDIQEKVKKYATVAKNRIENDNIDKKVVIPAIQKINSALTPLTTKEVKNIAELTQYVNDLKAAFTVADTELANIKKSIDSYCDKSAAEEDLSARCLFLRVFGFRIFDIEKMNPVGDAKEMNVDVRSMFKARRKCFRFALRINSRLMCMGCRFDKTKFINGGVMKINQNTCTKAVNHCLPFFKALEATKKYDETKITKQIDNMKKIADALEGVVALFTKAKDNKRVRDDNKNANKPKTLRFLNEDAKNTIKSIKEKFADLIKKFKDSNEFNAVRDAAEENTSDVAKKNLGCADDKCNALCDKLFKVASGGIDISIIRSNVGVTAKNRILTSVVDVNGADLESNDYKTEMEKTAEDFNDSGEYTELKDTEKDETDDLNLNGALLSFALMMISAIGLILI